MQFMSGVSNKISRKEIPIFPIHKQTKCGWREKSKKKKKKTGEKRNWEWNWTHRMHLSNMTLQTNSENQFGADLSNFCLSTGNKFWRGSGWNKTNEKGTQGSNKRKPLRIEKNWGFH